MVLLCSYESLESSKLPAFYIIYSQHPSHSGKIHGTVKERWQKGEAVVRKGMHAIASLAEQGRQDALLLKTNSACRASFCHHASSSIAPHWSEGFPHVSIAHMLVKSFRLVNCSFCGS